MKDAEQKTKPTETATASASNKRKRIAIEEPKKFLTVALTRLTAEELKTHGISLTVVDGKPTSNKRKHTEIDEPKEMIVRRMRTRSECKEKSIDNQSTKNNDRKTVKREEKAETTVPVSNKRKRTALEDPEDKKKSLRLRIRKQSAKVESL